MTAVNAEIVPVTKDFNSHTREGVTKRLICDILRIAHFNSHTREGVTTNIPISKYFCLNFNSHTREGVTINTCIIKYRLQFQLTHP